MSDAERRFHEQWIGMAQPSEGLVVSVPVLVEAQCAQRLPRDRHADFVASLVATADGGLLVPDLGALFSTVLDLDPGRFDQGDALPEALRLYVVEGKQTLRPTRALRWTKPRPDPVPAAEQTPASSAGRPYAMLVWEVPPAVTDLDRAETVTGAWDYPAQAKFERLLRECRVPIGLLSNGRELRLVYAPHGESSGWLAFRVADMASVSGRPLFDALVMLLSRERWFAVVEAQSLPAILAESRQRNADVTNELSRQVFEALELLLAGFAAADERDGSGALRAALASGDDHLYAGLLTVLLRLVFLLYCEDRGLLPTEHPLFAENYSLLGLFGSLRSDHGLHPDTMHRRFGAYPRLIALFRAVFLGVAHRDLTIPARRGQLFDPNTFPFLEGRDAGSSAPINQPEDRAAVRLPSVDDRTVFLVLEKLLSLDGQRLSYRALDVEQIGSVYEALMGFAIRRLDHGAVRIRLGSKKGAARVWLEASTLLAQPPAQRERWLQDELGFDKAVAARIAATVARAKTTDDALTALEPLSGRSPERAPAGSLVVQPGPERRRTSSHYTPRSLTEPIVARTLEPLLRAMGDAPSSDALLSLVICDPAVGSGAFLVAACRYLADRVVAAWTREGKIDEIARDYHARLAADRPAHRPSDEGREAPPVPPLRGKGGSDGEPLHGSSLPASSQPAAGTGDPASSQPAASTGDPASSRPATSTDGGRPGEHRAPPHDEAGSAPPLAAQGGDRGGRPTLDARERGGSTHDEAGSAPPLAAQGGDRGGRRTPTAPPPPSEARSAVELYDVVNHARRLVAQRCLYGVDKNRYAVQLARLSLWLVTMARHEPFTFVDHAIRHGDSLVGLSFEQLRGFHWKPKAQTEIAARELSAALDEAIAIRQRILELAAEGTYAAQRLKENLLRDAEDALDRIRLIGDLVVGAFFSQKTDKDRERERNRRLDLVSTWLTAEHDTPLLAPPLKEELKALQAELLETQTPFHWMIEFPEVFYAERPDPLDGGKNNGAAFVDAFVGNPPFASKNGIVASGGREYVPWLLATYSESHGNADISAYFLRRAGQLVGTHGTMGFVATNTISQGDTRTTGLAFLLNSGVSVIWAERDAPWAGDAAVMVSSVIMSVGQTSEQRSPNLNGVEVGSIDSRLQATKERPNAKALSVMSRFFFMGSKVYGDGFFVEEPVVSVLQQDPSYQEVVLPVIGGGDVNTDPLQRPPRQLIAFGQRSLSEANQWPRSIEVVERLVRPERERANEATADGAHRKKYWWQHAQPRPELYEAVHPLTRCLVTANVTKHLIFSFQPTNIYFTHTLYVFPLSTFTAFIVLQSRLHEAWARLLSSSMKTDLRYAASDCFETFPFPQPDPRTVIPALEAIGEKLYETRAAFMVATDQGLTKTYNALKNPDNDDPRVVELRRLHEEMDRAVLDAYGWSDIAVPPYCPRTDEEKAAVKAFEDAVIDRLFALNAERAAEEAKAAPVTAKAPKGRKKPASEEAPKPAKAPRKKKSDEGQGKLGV